MKNLNSSILKGLRESYLLTVQSVALCTEGSDEYWRELEAGARTIQTVGAVFGASAAAKLQKEGQKLLKEKRRALGR